MRFLRFPQVRIAAIRYFQKFTRKGKACAPQEQQPQASSRNMPLTTSTTATVPALPVLRVCIGDYDVVKLKPDGHLVYVTVCVRPVRTDFAFFDGFVADTVALLGDSTKLQLMLADGPNRDHLTIATVCDSIVTCAKMHRTALELALQRALGHVSELGMHNRILAWTTTDAVCTDIDNVLALVPELVDLRLLTYRHTHMRRAAHQPLMRPVAAAVILIALANRAIDKLLLAYMQ